MTSHFIARMISFRSSPFPFVNPHVTSFMLFGAGMVAMRGRFGFDRCLASDLSWFLAWSSITLSVCDFDDLRKTDQ